MTYDEFNAFCGSFAATTHVVQWGGSEVCYNFHLLSNQLGFRPAPYIAESYSLVIAGLTKKKRKELGLLVE